MCREPMTDRIQHLPDMAEILFSHGVKDIIISPGSRNAPLIRAFYSRFKSGCKNLVDERSASYFALGQSLASGMPTVLISTSGTAALNYAPAVAEAFYQGVPLLVLTADRPPEWIGQQNNQAINQNNIFEKNIKASYTVPTEILHPDDLWYANRVINEAFHLTVSGRPGPVHINVPLREPLYEELPDSSPKVRVIKRETTESTLQKNSTLTADWESATSVMIVCGQLLPDKNLLQTLKLIAKDPRVVVVAEPVSNLQEAADISCPEVVLNSKTEYPEVGKPQVVIYFGGQVVSKKIKLFLRNLSKTTFYTISNDSQIIDTFQNLNTIIDADPQSVLNGLNTNKGTEKSEFKIFWEKEILKSKKLVAQYLSRTGFSDLSVFKHISEILPEDAVIFAGNSSVVRYLQYFGQKSRTVYSNRGVSGIDGCLSTAAGLASGVREQVYAVVGDLSFGYDSNALWNRDLRGNLKIILINNRGGGIFHLLKGPSQTEAFWTMINGFHPVEHKKISEAYGLSHLICSDEKNLTVMIENLTVKEKYAKVLEIQVPNHGEPQITKDFFKFLNNQYETEMDND